MAGSGRLQDFKTPYSHLFSLELRQVLYPLCIITSLKKNLRIVSAMDTDCHPRRPRRQKPHIKGTLDRPPRLSPVDKIINLHHGSTTAIEATPQRLQASKQYPIPSLPERIEQLQTQNSNLNHEVAYYREMEQYREEFYNEVIQIKEDLKKTLSKFCRIQQQVHYEFAQLKQGSSTSVQKDTTTLEL
jgi:hypothetical protein